MIVDGHEIELRSSNLLISSQRVAINAVAELTCDCGIPSNNTFLDGYDIACW